MKLILIYSLILLHVFNAQAAEAPAIIKKNCESLAGWQSLPAELKNMINSSFLSYQIKSSGTLDEIIKEIKSKRLVDKRFKEQIDRATPALIKDLSYRFRGLVADEIRQLGKSYRDYEFDTAKKFGTPAAKAWVNKRTTEIPQENGFLSAIYTGDILELNSLLERNIDSNTMSEDGNPMLCITVAYQEPKLTKNRFAIVETLLKNNANPNLATLIGNTPLHRVESADIAQLLLDYKAYVNAKNIYNQTPLMYSSSGSEFSNDFIKIIQVFLAAGADVNAVDNSKPFGKTALDWAILAKNESAVNVLKSHNAKSAIELP